MTEQERLATGALSYHECDQGIMCCNRSSPDCEFYYDEMAEAGKCLDALLAEEPLYSQWFYSWPGKWYGLSTVLVAVVVAFCS